MAKARIFFTGVGGQGTLTATIILAQTAMAKGLPVTAGEVHGMAQRGGVVESTLLIGGFKSPRIAPGEADIVLGFEPLETLRALPYLKKGGTVVSNDEIIPPIGVTMGRETYPEIDEIKSTVRSCAGKAVFLPCLSLGAEAGAVQCGNLSLMAALCATGVLPLTPDDLAQTVKTRLNPKIVDMNLRAVELGVQAASS
ncbi:indolepyruvate oxidoreductase subunit beta [Desulfocurvus sp. DL9XJH121]